MVFRVNKSRVYFPSRCFAPDLCSAKALSRGCARSKPILYSFYSRWKFVTHQSRLSLVFRLRLEREGQSPSSRLRAQGALVSGADQNAHAFALFYFRGIAPNHWRFYKLTVREGEVSSSSLITVLTTAIVTSIALLSTTTTIFDSSIWLAFRTFHVFILPNLPLHIQQRQIRQVVKIESSKAIAKLK